MSDTSATRVQHERHKCDTSETREESKKRSHKRKKHDIIDEVCSFSKHSNISFKNVDVTREKNDATDTKYVLTCTQTDESFFVINDVPMNEYSDLTDFSDDEWKESDHEEHDWGEEDHCNIDDDEVESECIKNKYLLVEWAQLESLLKKSLVCGRKTAILKIVSRGSLIKVHVKCEKHTSEWTSQLLRKGIAEWNIAVSAGIVLSGMI